MASNTRMGRGRSCTRIGRTFGACCIGRKIGVQTSILRSFVSFDGLPVNSDIPGSKRPAQALRTRETAAVSCDVSPGTAAVSFDVSPGLRRRPPTSRSWPGAGIPTLAAAGPRTRPVDPVQGSQTPPRRRNGPLRPSRSRAANWTAARSGGDRRASRVPYQVAPAGPRWPARLPGRRVCRAAALRSLTRVCPRRQGKRRSRASS